MDPVTFRNFCLNLKCTEERFPFDENTLVFYVGSKMFCLVDIDTFQSFNVKCDPDHALELRDQYDEVCPGYHMNKKHWNTVSLTGNLPDHLILKWIKDSYDLVVAGLPRKLRESICNGCTT